MVFKCASQKYVKRTLCPLRKKVSKDSESQGANVQYVKLCCNYELSKYREAESSQVVTDYKHQYIEC